MSRRQDGPGCPETQQQIRQVAVRVRSAGPGRRGQAGGQAQQVAARPPIRQDRWRVRSRTRPGQATQQAQDTAGQVTDQAGQAQATVAGPPGAAQQGPAGGGPLGGVTDQVGQTAQGVQDHGWTGRGTGPGSRWTGHGSGRTGSGPGPGRGRWGSPAGPGHGGSGSPARTAGSAAGPTGGPAGRRRPATAAERHAGRRSRRLRSWAWTSPRSRAPGAEGRITVRDVIAASNQ